MKKLLIVSLMLIISQPCVFATIEVNYNNAGAVINNYTPRFGQNSALAPQNLEEAAFRNRQQEYEKMYYENLGKPRTIIINTYSNANSSDTNAAQQTTSLNNETAANDTANTKKSKKTVKLGTKKSSNGVTYYNVPIEE